LRATSPSQWSRFDFFDFSTADLQQRVHREFIALLHFQTKTPRISTRSLKARIQARSADADELSQGNVLERNIHVFCCIWFVVADNLLVLLYVTRSYEDHALSHSYVTFSIMIAEGLARRKVVNFVTCIFGFPVIAHRSKTMNIGQSPDAPILWDIRIAVDIYSIHNNSPKPQRFS